MDTSQPSKVEKWKFIQNPLTCHVTYFPITEIKMSHGNTLQEEKFILAPSCRETVSHDGEGMAEHLPWWQEPEVAAHPFWWIGKLRKDCRWSWLYPSRHCYMAWCLAGRPCFREATTSLNNAIVWEPNSDSIHTGVLASQLDQSSSKT